MSGLLNRVLREREAMYEVTSDPKPEKSALGTGPLVIRGEGEAISLLIATFPLEEQRGARWALNALKSSTVVHGPERGLLIMLNVWERMQEHGSKRN